MKNWFDHDYSARNDERILELRAEYGAEGYGIYWMLIETLAENGGTLDRRRMGGLSLALGVAKATLEGVIDACISSGLFETENSLFWSGRLNKHLSKVNALSEAGRKGAEKRIENRRNKQDLSRAEATLKPPLSHPSTEENRIEENRRDNTLHTQADPWKAKGYDKPESLDVVVQVAEMSGFTKDVAERYWNKRRSTGWTKPNGGQQVPIADWRADFATIAKMIEGDIRKEQEPKTNQQPQRRDVKSSDLDWNFIMGKTK